MFTEVFKSIEKIKYKLWKNKDFYAKLVFDR